jgi:hypothetical protein
MTIPIAAMPAPRLICNKNAAIASPTVTTYPPTQNKNQLFRLFILKRLHTNRAKRVKPRKKMGVIT